MDLKKCLRILNLEQATSIADVEQAYREMIDTWQPERFAPNSPLRLQAEEQLKKINIASKKLITYLSSDQANNKLSMLEPKPPATTSFYSKYANPPKPRTGKYLRSGDNTRPRKPVPKKMAGATPAAGTGSSLAGKYIVVGLLLIFVAITALILNYLKNVDQSSFESKPHSSLLKRLASDGSQPTPDENAKSSKNKSAKLKAQELEPKAKITTRPYRYFEIHLNEGNIIIADKWWEENNMIMYTTKYGTMGLEKSAVRKIISK